MTRLPVWECGARETVMRGGGAYESCHGHRTVCTHPIVKILVPDHALDASVIRVGGTLRICQRQRSIKYIQSCAGQNVDDIARSDARAQHNEHQVFVGATEHGPFIKRILEVGNLTRRAKASRGQLLEKRGGPLDKLLLGANITNTEKVK